MSKILDKIITLKEDFSKDWKQSLDAIGIWEDVGMLYEKKWPTDFCNRVLAFVVLAYDNQSGWVESNKDRWGNKEKIASRLGMDIKDKRVKDIIENNSQVVIDLVAWFIDYQIDWRWEAIVSHFEMASQMMRLARTKTYEELEVDHEEGGKKIVQSLTVEEIAKGNTAKGKNLMDAIEHRRKGEELLKEIQEQFVQLDNVMMKEGKRKVTDKGAIENWEVFIKELHGHE